MATTDTRNTSSDTSNLLWIILAVVVAVAAIFFAVNYSTSDDMTAGTMVEESTISPAAGAMDEDSNTSPVMTDEESTAY